MQERVLSPNLQEEVVDTYLDGIIASFGVCNCPQCRADIMAITLNSLPPRYVVATKSDVYVRVSAMSSQDQADIFAAATKAIRVVAQNPRH